MATIISLILDLRQQKTDGTYPVCLFLNFKSKRSYIRIERGPSVKAQYWSQETSRITKGCQIHPNPGHWNQFLGEKLTAAEKIVEQARADATLDHYTHEELKNLIKHRRPKPILFTEYIDNLIEEFRLSGNQGQQRIYDSARTFLKKYGDLPENGYAFKDVNYRLIRLIEERYTPRVAGNVNGLSVYLRTIRAVWNRAIKEGVTTRDAYPFDKYSIRKSKTHKTAISQADFDKIAAMHLPKNTEAWHGRNMFFFSFLCRGMNFADIAELKYSNLIAGRIVYVRKKVGKEFTIKINEQVKAILDLYILPDAKPNDYIFPPLITTCSKTTSDQARAYLSVVNHALKRWSKQLELDQSLSFNTARHSWATIGRNLNMPIAMISQGLGHADIPTTQIYLDDFDTTAMDEAESVIINGFTLPALNDV